MIDYAEALQYAKLVKIAEDRALPVSGTVEPAVFIYGRELASYFKPDLGAEDVFGFVNLTQDGTLQVILRCTETRLEAIHDMAFVSLPNPIPGGLGWVADGFAALYESLYVRRSAYSDKMTLAQYIAWYICHNTRQIAIKKLVLSGHSLGGPLVTMLGLDLTINYKIPAPTVYTFGSPRVGGMVFASQYNHYVPNSFRVVLEGDLVEYVPILPAYYHVDTRYELTPTAGTIAWGLLARHHITSYIWELEHLVPDSGNDPLSSDSIPGPGLWERIKRWFTK